MPLRSLLILAPVFFFMTAQAQSTSAKTSSFSHWSFDYSIGPSFPVGKFAAKPAGASGGNVQVGFNTQLSGAWWITRCVGVVLAVSGQENGVADQVSASSGTSFSVHSDHWKFARFLAGGVYSHRLSSRGLSLQVRALAGVLKTSIPGGSFSLQSSSLGGETIHGSIYSAPLDWTFAYEADAGLRWQLRSKLFLLLDVGYANASPVYHYYPVVFSADGTVVQDRSQTQKKNIPTSSLQFRLGVGVRL